jgi:hypothetical protein
MAIEFTPSPAVQDVRRRVRMFTAEEARPAEEKLRHGEVDRNACIAAIAGLRQRADEFGL